MRHCYVSFIISVLFQQVGASWSYGIWEDRENEWLRKYAKRDVDLLSIDCQTEPVQETKVRIIRQDNFNKVFTIE